MRSTAYGLSPAMETERFAAISMIFAARYFIALLRGFHTNVKTRRRPYTRKGRNLKGKAKTHRMFKMEKLVL